MTELGPLSTEEDGLRGRVRDAAAALEQAILDGSACQAVAEEDIQRLLAAATKIYVGKLEQHRCFPPFPTAGTLLVTATEVAATASAMLKALQNEIFELGMWQTHGGL